ncbi:MAG: DNA-binding protein [Firmicutes bacterium HGW-Firmicutes-14]|nr:MAG: DNA-binding protein [Firmicutes bacterium HGW-Firmicutes-14]
MNKSLIGANLRRIREAQGLSQSEVADRSGISRLAYRNIETGSSTPKVSTLQNIVAGMGIKLQDLFVPLRTLKNVRFRALKKMNSRENILCEVARWLDDFNQLEDLLKQNKPYCLANLPGQLSKRKGLSKAKRAAELARQELKLGEKEPIRDISGLLESCGIKVYPLTLASDGFFGLSVSEKDGGPAVVVNVWDRISVERWIFSAAHELGHLLLHINTYDVDKVVEDSDEEKEANFFASYFLMPEKVFESEWEDTYGLYFLDRVFKVKRIFQVSYKTVLYRLAEKYGSVVWGKFQAAYKLRYRKTLNFTDEPEALSPEEFGHVPEILRAREPDSLSPSSFMEDRLSKLVREAIEKDKITLSRGAEILRLDLESMRERIALWD